MAKTSKYAKTLFPKADLERLFADLREKDEKITFLQNVVEVSGEERTKYGRECLALEKMNRDAINELMKLRADLGSLHIDQRLISDRHKAELENVKYGAIALTTFLWVFLSALGHVFLPGWIAAWL